MKVLLVRPVTSDKLVLNCVPLLGLGYLASALSKIGVSVRILSCVKEKMGQSELIAYIKGYCPDVVGFTAFTHDIPSVKESLGLIKNYRRDITTIVGGPHISAIPEETFNYLGGSIDFGFKGEAEVGLPMLVRRLGGEYGLELSTIAGLIRREGARVIVNEQIFVEDLDKFDMPAWELMDPRTYPDAPQGVIFRQSPIAPIMATRGCPYRCTFCAGNVVGGRKIRTRSLPNVMAEIRHLAENYGVREFHILDDNFSMDRSFVREFCKAIIDYNPNLSWCCPNGLRLDRLDAETVKLMKRSGCYYISVGIESGSDRMLKKVKKGFTVAQIKEQVWMVKNAGMDVNGFFILGLPSETKEEMEATIRLAKELPLSRVQFYNFIPLPSTESYDELVRQGEIGALNWEHAFQAEVSYSPAGISKESLKAMQKRAHLEFYLRPSILWNLLTQIRSFEQFMFIVKRAFAYIG
ncbi:MAG: radical SAM protein [Candidatus Omnitrophica bacterium]|nr:radical SAM protein [Candidatus Omnitrophota bacterium]